MVSVGNCVLSLQRVGDEAVGLLPAIEERFFVVAVFLLNLPEVFEYLPENLELRSEEIGLGLVAVYHEIFQGQPDITEG